MIYKIGIENFFSIADGQEITLEVPQNAPDLPCFKKSLSQEEGVRLPSVVGFFGPNASGKSTILRGMVSLITFAVGSFAWEKQLFRLFQPYRQVEWWDKPTKLVLEFDGRLNDSEPLSKFRYELHIANKAKNFMEKSVAYEALFFAPKGKLRCLFERRDQQFSFRKEFGIPNKDVRKDSIRSDAGVISTLTQLNHPMSIYLCKLLAEVATNNIGLHRIQPRPDQWFSIYMNDQKCLEGLNKELRRFDVGLESMSIEKDNEGNPIVKFKHTGLDGDIYFPEESSGTKRLIETFPLLYSALEKGGIAIIDELDNDFHPLLLPELFRWFSSPERNPHGAQLFFTGHNPAILDELEKEQIFFTEKPNGEASRVYGAREIKGLRRVPSLMKKYLSGELGAVPHIG